MTKKLNLAILTNERPNDYDLWVSACKLRNSELEYTVIDLTKYNWLEKINEKQYDYLLTKPSCQTNPFKQLYDERLNILTQDLKFKSFPKLEEVIIYENKRYFSFWLKANQVPHPKTVVFYHLQEALNYLKKTDYPLVGKLNIGASGHGVEILNNRKEAEIYLRMVFDKGKTSNTGPNIKKGKLIQRTFIKIVKPGQLWDRIKIYKAIAADSQKGFAIIQEFIPHQYEWRVVRIGDSFFAHKKLLKKDKASGSLLKGYENPPLELLDFVRKLTNQFDFHSQAVDIFEYNGKYLVNEMQCIFGQSDPYQMLVDGKPGRYRFVKNSWIFEEGDFCGNQCYDLRLNYVIEQLETS